MNSRFHAAFVIARRDFVATVHARTFIFFLLAPMIVLGFSFLSGTVGASMAQQDNRATVAVIGSDAEFQRIDRAYKRVAPAFGENSLPDLVHAAPDYDVPMQAMDLLNATDKQVLAVLTGGIERPKLTGAISETGSIRRQMTLVIEEARQEAALTASGRRMAPTELQFVKIDESAGSLANVRTATARMGQFLLFFLTVFLAGMVLSQLIEEKSNKVIEVLTAAVPIDAVFFGKLFAMLAVSLLGIAVWTATALIGLLIWSEGSFNLVAPAVGWPLFVILGIIYFAFNYLLLGGLFLGLGSQASSAREVQTLSMPVTIGQVLIFFFASLAVGQPDSLMGLLAAGIPFSSPLAMIARAAQMGELWPHLLAILWQGLWVWLIVRLGAGLFRRNVMKSGSGPAPARGRAA